MLRQAEGVVISYVQERQVYETNYVRKEKCVFLNGGEKGRFLTEERNLVLHVSTTFMEISNNTVIKYCETNILSYGRLPGRTAHGRTRHHMGELTRDRISGYPTNTKSCRQMQNDDSCWILQTKEAFSYDLHETNYGGGEHQLTPSDKHGNAVQDSSVKHP